MIDLVHSVHRSPHSSIPIRLNNGFHSDLAWWKAFVSKWNGMSFLPAPPHYPTVELSSDTSNSWGCGAWFQNSWFQVPWDGRSQPLSIASKELTPIILAYAPWGHQQWGHQVVCNCDNQVVVARLHTRTSKHKGPMHLLRCLVFVEAHFKCHIYLAYINTRLEHLADDLSRNI